MSEVSEFENVTTLEDLFRSRAFDQAHRPRRVTAPPRAQVGPSSRLEDLLLGRFDDATVPVADLPRTPVGPRPPTPVRAGGSRHDTTTHLRRNRVIATVSGIAAAFLLAIGVITSPRTGRPSPGEQASRTTTSTPSTTHHTTPTHHTTSGSSTTPAPTGGTHTTAPAGSTTGAGSATIQLASDTVGSGPAPTTVPPTATLPPGAPGAGQPGPGGSQPAPPAATGTVLSPVVHLVGQVVKTTGTTVTGLSGGLGGALPVLSPVTDLTGGLGSTLSGLGDDLIATA